MLSIKQLPYPLEVGTIFTHSRKETFTTYEWKYEIVHLHHGNGYDTNDCITLKPLESPDGDKMQFDVEPRWFEQRNVKIVGESRVGVWALKEGGKWVRRISLRVADIYLNPYDLTDEMKKQGAGDVLALLPYGVNPNDDELLEKMRTKLLETVKRYRNDFYLHDIRLLFKHDKQALWMLRESGTEFFQTNGFTCEDMKSNMIYRYEYFHKQEREATGNVYRIDGNTLQKITYEQGLEILRAVKVSEEPKAS